MLSFDRAHPAPCSGPCQFEATSQTSSGTQSHAQWRLSDGQDRRAAPARIPFEAVSQDSAQSAIGCTRSSFYGLPPSRPGLCDQADSSPVPAGSSLSRLHKTTRLRPFSPLFHGFCARAQFFFDTLCHSCLRLPRKTPRGRPRNQGLVIRRDTSFGGLLAPSSPSSEDHTSFRGLIATSSTPSFLLFGNFSVYILSLPFSSRISFLRLPFFSLVYAPLCSLYLETLRGPLVRAACD
jgi:hypothetical protein